MRTSVLIAILVVVGVAHAETPAQRAKKFVDTQLATLADGSTRKMEELFDPEALVMGIHVNGQLKDYASDLYQAFAGGSPHVQIKKTKVKSLVAGGNDAATWFTAEVLITAGGPEPGFGYSSGTTTLRVTQLIVPQGGTWKVVAATIDRPGKPNDYTSPRNPVAGATTAGPLASLTSVAAIEAALAKDSGVFVIGTDKRERAIGPAKAKKLLRSWGKLTLERDAEVREVTTKTYGFLQSHVYLVKGKQRFAMGMLLIALPAPDGTWQVAGVHYTSL